MEYPRILFSCDALFILYWSKVGREMTNNINRIEKDAIGTLTVPSDALFGIQTQRALLLYPLAGEKPLSAYPEYLQAILQVKLCAAFTNIKTTELSPVMGEAIVNAIKHLLKEMPANEFPVHAFHGGGGISTNMNVNEVIANLANQRSFSQPLGSYATIHPNDHVNLNHSTSDLLTTACHIAITEKWQVLKRSLENMAAQFSAQAEKWAHINKISRTCLQDAVEISFADFFSGYTALVERNIHRIHTSVEQMYKVNLGGNIIGRQGDCSAAFFEHCIPNLNAVLGSDKFTRSKNLFDCSQNNDDMLSINSDLDTLARGLIKIAKDFRLLCSGPDCGFAEIQLPAVQPGSSAMPGKINPTIPEFLIQSAMQVCGKCHSAQMTQDHGELDLNVWQSVLISNLLDAMNCLDNAIKVFTTHALSGVQPNLQRNSDNTNTLIPLLIKLKQQKGYSYSAKVYRESNGDLDIIRSHLTTSSQGVINRN